MEPTEALTLASWFPIHQIHDIKANPKLLRRRFFTRIFLAMPMRANHTSKQNVVCKATRLLCPSNRWQRLTN